MTGLISRDAAIGALEERRDQYLPDSTTWLQIQLDIRAIAALPAVTPAVRAPTEAQIASACLSYRHDFGLMDGPERVALMHQAREWLHAWRKEFAALPAAAPVAGLVDSENAFMGAVWDALKADANDLRKQQRILIAFRAALAAMEAGNG